MQIVKLDLFKNGIGYVCIDGEINLGEHIIVEGSKGLELATVSGLNSKYDTNFEMLTFLKVANDDDINNAYNLFLEAQKLEDKVREIIRANGIDLKLCFLNYNLDKTKLIIYYTADGRVDFRNLVKILANNFHTRIEMRQIGNRDEVQIIGAMGSCGRECCCKVFLKDFDKVSMKMAKNQSVSLTPSKINGMCGRLMCCLKYEDDNYKEVLSKMPKVNSFVLTSNGSAKVVFLDILREEVTVLYEQGDETEKKTLKLQDISFDKSVSGFYA